MRVLPIANPIAGRGGGPREAERLAGLLRRGGHHVEVCVTRGPRDAGRRVRGAEAQFDRIAVAGGDGTLNEVVNGVADPSRVPIAYLACGTGNMLSHELGLPASAEAVADLVAGQAIRRIDIGRVGEHRFLGLFTARAYSQDASTIPILRRKLREILRLENAHRGSHDYNLILALEVFEHIDERNAIGCFPEGVHVLFSVPDFVETAHLRAYQDPQRDIIDYYAGREALLAVDGIGTVGEVLTRIVEALAE